MHTFDDHLKSLVEMGKEQGFLTFAQVNDYLPDEAVNPEKLDNLLSSLQELGLEIRVEADLPSTPPREKAPAEGQGDGRPQAGGIAPDGRPGAGLSRPDG